MHVSRPKEEILQEVRELVAEGVKEFQIIAQELTYYGVDIDGKQITGICGNIVEINIVVAEGKRLENPLPNLYGYRNRSYLLP